jgi:hypothetical protein
MDIWLVSPENNDQRHVEHTMLHVDFLLVSS